MKAMKYKFGQLCSGFIFYCLVFWTFLLVFAVPEIYGLGWLAVASVGIQHKESCRSRGLTRKQTRICRRHLPHMQSVQAGAHLAIRECQYQFKNRHWNCTVERPNEILTSLLGTGTRESAFVHAITSAGVTHTITHDCSTGRLLSCGCDMSMQGVKSKGFQWSGCSDNIHYGSFFSKIFIDAHERRKNSDYGRHLMNLHNNDAGRKAVEQNMRVHCKCHGVSGSCELRTCWRRMPTFREVGHILKNHFDGATQVKLVKKDSRRVLTPASVNYKMYGPNDLVYLEQSPDFCEYNRTMGVLGTHGRECNKTSNGIDGCDILCCNRGFRTAVESSIERCHCKFHWCCEVKCKKCIETKEINRCL